jgi:hypothetical protein
MIQQYYQSLDEKTKSVYCNGIKSHRVVFKIKGFMKGQIYRKTGKNCFQKYILQNTVHYNELTFMGMLGGQNVNFQKH